MSRGVDERELASSRPAATVLASLSSSMTKRPRYVSMPTPVKVPCCATSCPFSERGMCSRRAFSRHSSCTCRARPRYSAHTSQPPSKPAQSPWGGVRMTKIRSSTHAATWTGVGRRAKKRATDLTRAPSGLPAVFWPNWQLAKRKIWPSIMMPLMSLSHPPLHVDGVQPLTSASIQVTRACPSAAVRQRAALWAEARLRIRPTGRGDTRPICRR